jgi:hypothetical protein
LRPSAAVTAAKNIPVRISEEMSNAQAQAPAVDVPTEKLLTHAAKIAIETDKPILLDYYGDTKAGTAFLGEDADTKEKILFKNNEEYTSPITKLYKTADGYIMVTENSVYLVHGNIKKKAISTAGL